MMKRIPGLDILALGLALWVLNPQQAVAQSILFEDFSDLSGFGLNGSAGGAVNLQGDDVLRLTPAQYSQAGSAFLLDPISLAGDAAFSAAFSFQITNSGGCCWDTDGPGADGLVFVVTQTPNAVGLPGVGIGYQGIANSIGVEFDTWNNGLSWGDDTSGNHVAVNRDGDIVNHIGYADVATRLNDGNIWSAWVDYNGQSSTLEVRLSQSSERPAVPLITVVADLAAALGDEVYIGFTSGTGGAYGNHDVVALQFNDEYDPIGSGPTPVAIDIKPGSDTNPISLKSKGLVPVAVLTSDDVDAADIDPSTVTLGDDDGNDTPVAPRKKGRLHAALEDVDGDGRDDLVLHFDTQALIGNGDLTVASGALTLNGATEDGTTLQGADVVRIAPGSGRGPAAKSAGSESVTWGEIKAHRRQ